MGKRYFTKTDDIAHSLKEYAKNFKVPHKEVDFTISEIYTEYKNESHKEFELLESDKLAKLQDPEFLNDPSLEIRQYFEIEIYRKANPNTMAIKIGANKDKTKVVLVIQEGTKLKYSQKLVEYIYRNIKKQMALHGYIVGVWEYDEELKEFFTVLENTEKIKYGQRQYIEIARTPLPRVAPVDDGLIYNYKSAQMIKDEYDRVDHAKRGFAFGVKKGDVVLQYVKPQEGRCGRDCKGKFLPVKEPTQNNVPDFNINEDIEIAEKEETTDYKAKKSGYVIFENNTYSIEQYLEVDVVDFKTTGDIDLGIESEVRLVVNGSNDMNDSIGQGIEVNAKELNVLEGTIGAGVIIRASKINISSITHQNSKIFGDDITINVHNGYVKGKTVYVKRLEGGVIEGEKVVVEQAVGGEIRGNEVHIDLLTSNSIIYASSIIEVTNLKGEDNEFIIEPTMVSGLKEELEHLTQQKHKFKTARANIYKELKQKRAGLKQNEKVLKQIKEQIQYNKENNIKIPSAYIEKIKKLQIVFKSVKLLDEELILIDDELTKIEEQIAIKQSIILNAKVVNKTQWSGYNKVSFSLISPQMIAETTTEGKKNVIRLKEDGSGEYKIESEDLNDLHDLEQD